LSRIQVNCYQPFTGTRANKSFRLSAHRLHTSDSVNPRSREESFQVRARCQAPSMLAHALQQLPTPILLE
ncbi:hypothetical protein, partial [Aeribacillus composti]|uniref:hypothetical protein n=1 Tax=Aeribacillus composti TaxID=1868734 RepID=UPI002E1DB858|nr:hypothetical protein [Aeribacillus composti]